MEHFLNMLSTQMILMIYMAVGFYCRKRGILEQNVQPRLTDFVLRVTLPCMIFNSFNVHLTPELLRQASLCLGVAFFLSFVSWIGGKWIYNMYPQEKKKVLQYATLVNNSGFLGLPIISSVLGEQGLLLAAVFIIPNRIFMWTAGVAIFMKQTSRKEVFKNVMLNPCILVIFLGLFRSLTDVTLPKFVSAVVTGLGDSTTPLSMVLIGAMLTELKLHDFLDWSMVYLAAVRLLALPLLALVVMKLIQADTMMSACSVILTAMPTGSATALLAEKYGADAVYATKSVLTNTLFSLVTIPFMTLLA